MNLGTTFLEIPLRMSRLFLFKLQQQSIYLNINKIICNFEFGSRTVNSCEDKDEGD